MTKSKEETLKMLMSLTPATRIAVLLEARERKLARISSKYEFECCDSQRELDFRKKISGKY